MSFMLLLACCGLIGSQVLIGTVFKPISKTYSMYWLCVGYVSCTFQKCANRVRSTSAVCSVCMVAPPARLRRDELKLKYHRQLRADIAV